MKKVLNFISAPNSFLITVLLFISFSEVKAQGFNHNWLLGYSTGVDTNVISRRAFFQYDAINLNVVPTTFKMAFMATQGNISDENGNLLMVSNGCWIADASLDTMMNGSGLNPNLFTDDWNNSNSGLPIANAHIFLPYPEDSSKYILFHQTGNYNASLASTELYYSVIDISLNGGLGAVTQKNVIVVSDTLGWGIAATKHANGRDWWIVALSDSMKYCYSLLLTPNGIDTIFTQPFNNMNPYSPFAGQPVFSPDGSKFAFTSAFGGAVNWYHDVRLLDFDRCSGLFSNPSIIDITDTYPGLSTAFSSDSKYLYASSTVRVFQINTDTSNIAMSLQTVAVNDSFYSPIPPFATDFWHMYLAADGKIYISSGNGVIDMHFIEYPDSGGLGCNVQQHAIHLPCWSGRGHVNHPNYYLGCDTLSTCTCLTTGINDFIYDFNLSVAPNPNEGNFSISYLLPQNSKGKLEIYDMNGKCVYELILSAWSSLQKVYLPEGISSGIYNCVVSSGNKIINKKIAIIN